MDAKKRLSTIEKDIAKSAKKLQELRDARQAALAPIRPPKGRDRSLIPWLPLCGDRSRRYLVRGCTSQIARAYSITARSLENLPMLAVLRMVLRVHSSWLRKSASTRSCVST